MMKRGVGLLARGRFSKFGIGLSLFAGIMILGNSNILSWTFDAFPKSLMISSGVLILVASIFMYINPRHNLLWGTVILFSSPLGFIAMGIARIFGLMLWQGIFSLILGVVGGALIITER